MAFMRCEHCDCRIEDLADSEEDFADLGRVYAEHVAIDHPALPIVDLAAAIDAVAEMISETDSDFREAALHRVLDAARLWRDCGTDGKRG